MRRERCYSIDFSSRPWAKGKAVKALTENLFSYGTLQEASVQLKTFGRKLKGKPDALVRCTVNMVPIKNQRILAATGSTHHRTLKFTGIESDQVEGAVFALTLEELEQADAYEDAADYKRMLVKLRSGAEAWVYLYVEPGIT